MITSLRLENFKGFREIDLRLAPITLLTGVNGMGKSSVIQAFLLLRQSFASGDLSAGRLLIGGELVDLGTGVDLLFEDANSDSIAIGFTVKRPSSFLSGRSWLKRFTYDRTAETLLAVDSENKSDNLTGELVGQPPFAGRFAYVHAERVGPRKTLPLSDARVLAFDLGTKGEYVLHILLEHGSEALPDNDPRVSSGGPKLIDQVGAWLQEVSPGSHLAIDPVRSADLAIGGFSFDREGDIPSRVFRATNVVFGLSYVLPVIVALLSTKPGGLVLIENPEAHLHPKGQTRMGQLAARAAAAGVQVIAETHSDHFMNGVRIEVRGGAIKPTDAAFHYFHREKSEIVVTTPTIDSDGRLSSWPEGFFDQHDENLVSLLAPREK